MKKRFVVGLTFVAAIGLAGCEQGTPGGPGVKSEGAVTQRTTNKVTTDQGTTKQTVTKETKVTDKGTTKPADRMTVKDETKKPLFGNAENTFSLDMPNLATRLKQGEVKEVSVGISRGKNFDQDVTLKFENPPKGVTLDPSKVTIKRGEKNAKFKVKIADDGPIGDFSIKVDGQPATGAVATNKLDIVVSKK